MSSFPYYYFTAYQTNANDALQQLRQREFEAGRYNPALYDRANRFMSNFVFPPTEASMAPGPTHASIEEACKAGEGEGTGSILDIERVSDSPDFLTSSPLSSELLINLLGTDKPTHDLVDRVICREEPLDDDDDAWGDIADEMPVGVSLYFTVYKDNQPSELFFMGYGS